MSSGRAWRFGMILAAALGNPCAAIAASPQTDAAIKSLPFERGGNFTLPTSGGTLAVPARYYVLTGESAKTFYQLVNGLDAPKGLEAVMLTKDRNRWCCSRRSCPSISASMIGTRSMPPRSCRA
jgi:hypothetical protein